MRLFLLIVSLLLSLNSPLVLAADVPDTSGESSSGSEQSTEKPNDKPKEGSTEEEEPDCDE